MKVTSYKISKKLAEAWFEAGAQFYWVKWNEGEPELIHRAELTPALIEKVAAYDLETILDNISFVIQDLEKDKNYWFAMNQQDLSYISFDGETNIDFYTPRQENESLADTAARLLLKLIEKGLLTFNK